MIKAPDFITEFSLNGWRKLSVVVVGAGGTGSALLNKLFQLQITLMNLGSPGLDVTVFDHDEVSQSNIGRQSFWSADIGANKAEVLVDRYNRFGGINWKAENKAFNGIAGYVPSGVLIFGCVDNVEARKAMHKTMERTESVWIDCGNDSRSSNVLMGMNAMVSNKKVYLPSVYDLFKTQMDSQNVTPEPSCSTAEAVARQDFGINDITAAQAVQMLWQMIRHGEVGYQGVTVDLASGTTTPIEADPDVWAMFGYSQDKKKAA